MHVAHAVTWAQTNMPGSWKFLSSIICTSVCVCVSADLARYKLDFVIMDNTHRALDIHNDTHNFPLESI